MKLPPAWKVRREIWRILAGLKTWRAGCFFVACGIGTYRYARGS